MLSSQKLSPHEVYVDEEATGEADEEAGVDIEDVADEDGGADGCAAACIDGTAPVCCDVVDVTSCNHKTSPSMKPNPNDHDCPNRA